MLQSFLTGLGIGTGIGVMYLLSVAVYQVIELRRQKEMDGWYSKLEDQFAACVEEDSDCCNN